jgi:tetrahydromethanopterin S-methyltransferase subunit F
MTQVQNAVKKQSVKKVLTQKQEANIVLNKIISLGNNPTEKEQKNLIKDLKLNNQLEIARNLSEFATMKIKETKKATKKKVLTQKQKDAIAKKRALNPQFANLQSAKRKVENLEYKKDLKKILIEVKRTTTLNNVDTKSIENLVLHNQCKVAINYLLKNEAKYLPLLKQVVRTSKSGLYSPYFAEQTIQKIVKLKLNDGKSFEHSLRDLKK